MHTECAVVKSYDYRSAFSFRIEDRLAARGAALVAKALRQTATGGMPLSQNEILESGLTLNQFYNIAIQFTPQFFSLVQANPREKVRRPYDTWHGFIPFGSWDTYTESTRNLEKALTRITAARENELLLLRANKRATRHIFRDRGVGSLRKAVFGVIKDRLRQSLLVLEDNMTEQIKYALAPHQKRKIRVQAITQLITDCELFGIFTTKVKGKLKLYEKAKFGKYPRLIGDFSTPGSLLAGYLCEIAKNCFKDVTVRGTKFSFIKSIEPEILDAVGEELLQPGNAFFYHSDDSIHRVSGKIFELDISSCDMSNSRGVFQVVEWLFDSNPQFHNCIIGAVKQCQLPLKISDPLTNQSARFKPNSPTEFSGTVLTTLLNNIASLLIALQLHCDGARTVEEVKRSAASVGYIVTAEERPSLLKSQFLKHSWEIQDGNPKSFLNLGCILRSFGTCTGDLPGHGDVDARSREWCAAVLQGYVHSGQTSLLEKLNSIYPSSTNSRTISENMLHKHSCVSRRGPISDEAICERYGFSQAAWEHFLSLIEHGVVVHHSVLDAIYKADYGLDPLTKANV